MKRFVVPSALVLGFSLVSVVAPTGVSPVPGAGASVVPAVAEDPPAVPVVPLDELTYPLAQSNSAPSVALPDSMGALPDDAEGTATVAEDAWSSVPGMPVEVQVGDDPPAPEPGPGPGPEPGSGAPGQAPEDPADPAEGVAVSNVPEGAEVEVVLDQTADVGDGALLFEVLIDAADAVPSSGSDPGSGAGSDPGSGGGAGSAPLPGDPAASGQVAAVGVDVRVSYEEFEQIFGGRWSDRLRVMAYPGCFVSTPELAECSQGTVVAFENEAAEDRVGFTTLPPTDVNTTAPDDGSAAEGSALSPGGQADAVVYALAAGEGGFAATPVSSATQWQVGTGSGDFSYSYPFSLPSARAGATPSLSLDYSSGIVDAMTSENAQASAVGTGWTDMSVGSITRSFMACEDDEDDQGAGSEFAGRGDLCWRTGPVNDVRFEELTLSLAGRSSRLRLVRSDVPEGPGDFNNPDFVTDEFRLFEDPGWKITRRANATSNPSGLADDDREEWTVRTPDGTRYLFGSRPSESASTWTVPVHGNDPAEPCHTAGAGTSTGSWCQQAWQWNLDRVIDASNNEIVYTYAPEVNHYDRLGGENTAYHRAGALSKIEYGMWSPPGSQTPPGPPRQVVEIATAPRCLAALTAPGASCPTSGTGSMPGQWPDTPLDLVCDASGLCPSGPSFFSTRRYHQVLTKTMRGPGTGLTTPVATYTISHKLPDIDADVNNNVNGGEQADLWLYSVQVTGQADGTTTTLPHVFFDGEAFPNLVDPDGADELEKFRMFAVRNEMGGRVEVTYGHATGRACDPAYVANLARFASTRECFAVKDPEATGDGPEAFDWFHKYVVTTAASSDDALGYRVGLESATPSLGKAQVTDYEYLGAPAWRYRASRAVLEADQSWSDWRGYETTVARARAVTNQVATGVHSLTRVVRFRGMNGAPSNLSDGVLDNVRLGTVEDGDGEPGPLDQRWFNGLVAETELKYPDGELIRRDYTGYDAWTLESLNSPNLAKRVYTDHTNTTTRVTSGGSPSQRVHRVEYETYEGGTNHRGLLAGAVARTWDQGAAGDAGDDICTTTTYKTNEEQWHLATGTTTTYDDDCTSAGGTGSGPIVRRAESFYDGLENNPDLELTQGWLTATRVDTGPETGPGAGSPPIRTETDYDQYGRPLETRDGRGNRTQTIYNPPGLLSGAGAADVLERVQVTQIQDNTGGQPDPPDLVTTTDVSPATGMAQRMVDPNGQVTRMTHDGLGRLRKVFSATNLAAYPTGIASIEHTYTQSLRTDPAQPLGTDRPSRIKTTTLKDKAAGGTPATTIDSYTFYDGWGRVVETQSPSPTANRRLVVSTGYDERGLVQMTTGPYSATGTYYTIVNPDPTTLQRFQLTGYDAASRPLVVNDRGGTISYRSLTHQYFGDSTRTVPPGTGATTTHTDVWDRPLRVELSTAASGSPVVDQASYTYTAAGDLDTITKPLPGVTGPVTWDYDYDWAGRRIKSVDPDTAITVNGYDTASNPTSTETYAPTATYGQLGVLQERITTTYDDLNRPIGRFDATTGTQPADQLPLARWLYDTAPNGLGRLAATETTVRTTPEQPGLAEDPLSEETQEWHTSRLVNNYDPNGRATSTTIRYPDWLTNETPNVGTGAPLAGQLGPDANVAHTHTRSYDELDNTTVLTYPATPGIGAALPVTSTYEPTAARLARTSVGTQTQANATYNAIGQRTNLSSYNTTNATLSRDYTYEPVTGRLSALTATQRGPGTTTAPGTTSPIELAQWFYEYDTADNPQRITSSTQTTVGGAKKIASWCYDYDALNRLTRAFNGQPSTGTECTKATGGAATTVVDVTGPIHDLGYTYSGDRLATVNTPGTGTPATTMTYQWPDPTRPHQTRQINRSGSTATGIDITAAYDADGIRLARRHTQGSATITTVYLDALTEITHTNNLIAADTTTSTHHITTPDGTALATVDPTGWTWEVADLQGTLRLTRTQTGTIGRHHYYPHGSPTTTALPDTPNNRGYLNKHHDPNYDLRLDQRTYTPHLNILTTPDPLLNTTDPQTFNPYAHSRNNPVALSDPTGLSTICDGCGPNTTPDTYEPPPAPAPAPDPSDYLDEEPGSPFWADIYAQTFDSDGVAEHIAMEFAADEAGNLTFAREFYLTSISSDQETCKETPWCSPVTNPIVQEIVTSIGGVASLGLRAAGKVLGARFATNAPRTFKNLLPGLSSSAPKPLGLGSAGRTVPSNLTEQLAMTEVRSAPGGAAISRVTMSDPRWMASDGWIKMQQIVNGVNIHYVRNVATGAVDDFKFVTN